MVIKIRLISITFGLVLVVFAGINALKTPRLHVWFLDVGQGDSILIEAPNGNRMLLDGGLGSTVLRRLNDVLGFFDRSIPLVVMSHPDSDHIGGLPLVLDRYHISSFMEPGVSSDNTAYDAVENEVSKQNIPKILARRGMIIDLGGGVHFDVLFPDKDVTGWETNLASIVGQLRYGSTTIMLNGDSPQQIENYLVGLDGNILKSDVLKAGHHGSRTSSDENYVKTVSPEIAIISSGKNNRYGHPHKEVLDTFEKLGIPYMNTANEGTIECVSDGYTFACD